MTLDLKSDGMKLRKVEFIYLVNEFLFYMATINKFLGC